MTLAARPLGLLDSLLKLRTDLRETADAPYYGTSAFNSIIISDLLALLSFLEDPEPNIFRARATDLAWWQGRKCSHKAVETAVSDYLALARITLDLEHWLESFEFLSRAAAMASHLGRGGPIHRRALDTAFEIMTSIDNDPLYFSARTAQLLIEHRYSCPKAVGDAIQRAAEHALSRSDFHRARDLLDIVLQARHRQNDQAAAQQTRIEIASTLESHAADQESRGELLVASAFQRDAVEAWRAVSGAKKESYRARVELQRLQRLSVQQLSENAHSQKTDMSSIAMGARARVSGKPWLNAIVELSLFRPPNMPLDELRESAKKRVEEFKFYSLFPATHISYTGRAVHERPAGLDDPDAALDAAIRLDLSMLQQTIAIGGIIPAIEAIQLEHGLTSGLLLGPVSRSPFVPPDRATSFARGIALGFQKEFIVAAHILMPQFENSLRHQLELRGAVVSTLPPSGGQNEFHLGALLDTEEAKDFLGESELFEIKSLLVDKAGTNLRNELAHGLLPDGAKATHIIYFWWKVVQYVFLPLAPPSSLATDDIDDGSQTDSNEAGALAGGEQDGSPAPGS
ncbi:DUF4209 domain-containing protein [Sorangium sp. So ce1014]